MFSIPAWAANNGSPEQTAIATVKQFNKQSANFLLRAVKLPNTSAILVKQIKKVGLGSETLLASYLVSNNKVILSTKQTSSKQFYSLLEQLKSKQITIVSNTLVKVAIKPTPAPTVFVLPVAPTLYWCMFTNQFERNTEACFMKQSIPTPCATASPSPTPTVSPTIAPTATLAPTVLPTVTTEPSPTSLPEPVSVPFNPPAPIVVPIVPAPYIPPVISQPTPTPAAQIVTSTPTPDVTTGPAAVATKSISVYANTTGRVVLITPAQQSTLEAARATNSYTTLKSQYASYQIPSCYGLNSFYCKADLQVNPDAYIGWFDDTSESVIYYRADESDEILAGSSIDFDGFII